MTSIRSFLLNVEVLVLNFSAKHHGNVSVNCLGIIGETTLLAHLALFIGRFPDLQAEGNLCSWSQPS